MTLATEIDGPLVVVGDVHGHAELLRRLLCALEDAAHGFEDRWIVFVGDLIDRGPDSRGVLDLVCDLRERHPNTTAVCGNHELICARALELIPSDEPIDWEDWWVHTYKAESVFASYGVPERDLQALIRAMPESHKQLLRSLPWVVEHPQYLIVHAGLLPNVPLDTQLKQLRQRECVFDHPPWLCAKFPPDVGVPSDCERTIASGHTPVPNVIFAEQRIMIDIGAGHGRGLAAVLLPEQRVISVGHESGA